MFLAIGLIYWIESTSGEAYNRVAIRIHIPIQILAFDPTSRGQIEIIRLKVMSTFQVLKIHSDFFLHVKVLSYVNRIFHNLELSNPTSVGTDL